MKKEEKIDKRTCRKFADVPLKISASHGLLYAESVKYIICTAIRIIGHRRRLIVYIYLREKAAAGDLYPLWTIFHSREDYMTLERQDDGSTKWRESSFCRLDLDYYLSKRCAFLTLKDGQRIKDYFRSQKTGVEALEAAQARILDKRSALNRRLREKKILERMKPLPALPRDLRSWVQKSILPAYFFYDYEKKKAQNGCCTSCGHSVMPEKVKYHAKGVCPSCGRTFIMKSRKRRGYLYEQDTCQVIQRVGPELVIRILKVSAHYARNNDAPSLYIRENARIFLKKESEMDFQCESYYLSYTDVPLLSRWRRGRRPIPFGYGYRYNYEADLCGHLYCRNLSAVLADTPWQYCAIDKFYQHFKCPMTADDYLIGYLKHPVIELLLKTAFYVLVSKLIYRNYGYPILDESQKRLHRILQVNPEDTSYVCEKEMDLETLSLYQKYCQMNLKDRNNLMDWQMEHQVQRDVEKIIPHLTVHQFINYIEEQFSLMHLQKGKSSSVRYGDRQAVVHKYRDYLEICQKMNYDLKNSFVLYPKDLQKSHDDAARHLKLKKNERTRRDFQAVYEGLEGKMDFELDGMKIVYPKTVDDIVREGQTLHHCVGTYGERVAEKECVILFLRKTEKPEKSYYTIEIQGQEVIQVEGYSHLAPTPEVETFMEEWKQQVLYRQEIPMAA